MDTPQDGWLAALDQGTTSTRLIIFDTRGRPVAQDQIEHRQLFPRPGEVEHDPLEIWANVQKVLVGALAAAGIPPEGIRSLGITNQRETVLLWDPVTGRPHHNALVWQDTRTTTRCSKLAQTHQDLLRERTGLPAATYFSASKLAWLMDNITDARSLADRGRLIAGTMDTWLLWNLTGGPQGGLHLTDASNASRTQLMDLEGLRWAPELLDLFDIPPGILPAIVPSIQDFGTAQVLGYRWHLGSVLGDQHAALFGQVCFHPGEAKNTYGTGCFLLLNTGTVRPRSANGLLSTLAWHIQGQAPVYALEGSVAVTGSLVQWLRDNLGIIESSADIEALAVQVPDNGDVYVVPAFSGLFAPWWKAEARGVIAGLTRYATKAHVARAALEASAYQTLDVLRAMEKDAGFPLRSLKVDGGMTGNRLLMQFQADILGASVTRPVVAETTALGAALAAGLSAGVYTSLDQIRDLWAADTTWEPVMAASERIRLVDRWHQAVRMSMEWQGEPG